MGACLDCFNCRTKVGLDWKPTIVAIGKGVLVPRGRISFNDSVKECFCRVGRWIKENGDSDSIMLPYVMGANFKYNNEKCPDFDGEKGE
jgi:hypothetical protein